MTCSSKWQSALFVIPTEWYQKVSWGTKLPCIGSHEGSGTVVKVGSAISEFKVGNRVFCSLTYHRCQTCKDCKGPEQDTQYCANGVGYLGVTTDGSFAEYELVDAENAVDSRIMSALSQQLLWHALA